MLSQSRALRRGIHILPRLSITHVLCLTILAGILFIANTTPVIPNDFWWHLQAGRMIAETGRIPSGDTLSFTVPGVSYPNYSAYWLAEFALYELYASGGLALVVAVHSLLVISAYGLLLWLCARIAGDWRHAYRCILLAAAVGFLNWNVRPQTVGYLLCVVFLCAIYEYRRRPRLAWLVIFPAGMLLWVNSHGSFVIGLLLLGVWLVDRVGLMLAARLHGEKCDARRLGAPAFALGSALLSCLINPRGYGAITYLMAMSGNSVVRNLVSEWRPTSVEFLGGSIFLILMLLTAALLIVSPRRASFFQLLMFLSIAFLGLQAVRNTVWFGFVIAPILADHLPAIGEWVKRRNARLRTAPATEGALSSAPLGGMTARERLNLALTGIAMVLAVVSLPWFKQRLPLPPALVPLVSPGTPVSATRYLLGRHPPGRLFNELGFGSYLIWAAQPDYPVFIDPRFEIYPSNIMLDYLRISNAVGDWEGSLDRYGVRVLMLSPREQPALVSAAALSSHWERIYDDASAVIYVRNASTNP